MAQTPSARRIALGAALWLFAACHRYPRPTAASPSAVPPSAQAVDVAHRKVAAAQAGPAAVLSGPALPDARRELAEAQRQQRRGDTARAEQHAQAAGRLAEAAQATAGLALAQHGIEQNQERQKAAEAAEAGAQALLRPAQQPEASAQTTELAQALRTQLPQWLVEPADHGGFCLTLAQEKAFRGHSLSLLPSARKQLKSLAQVLGAAGHARVKVLGRVPGLLVSGKAVRLAESRTHAVIAEMLSHGVGAPLVQPFAPAPGAPKSARAQTVGEEIDEADLHVVVQSVPAPTAP